MYSRFLKRAIDFALALFALIVLSPILLIISILVKINLGSPIFFRQKRPGLNEKIFIIYKFRSMTDERDENGRLLPGKKRLNWFGKFLRSTSLDELPELWNILKGEMSFVGPRPLAIEYLPYYTQKERMRHGVRPGLTGLAQINGRNTIIWEERFAFDLEYVDNISFLTDLRIILKTIGLVLRREDIGHPGKDRPISLHRYRTIKRFKGSDF